MNIAVYFLIVFSVLSLTFGFNIQSSRKPIQKLVTNMHFEEAVLGNTALVDGALTRQRYIATNRFKVRKNNGPKFEKRWAERKSRLAKLDGFRFFTLLRRIDENGNTYEGNDELGNYVSFTIWEDKKHFDEWRTGEAFKEAHGGGGEIPNLNLTFHNFLLLGITDFIQLLSTALFILNGAPKPAFYDGLLPCSNGKLGFESDEGWRKIEADGKNYLPVDVFVVQNKLNIPDDQIVNYESQIKESNNDKYKGYEGFLGSLVLRRDATKADDTYNYIETVIWKDKESYENYLSAVTLISLSSFSPPNNKSALYEGKLALSSQAGI